MLAVELIALAAALAPASTIQSSQNCSGPLSPLCENELGNG